MDRTSETCLSRENPDTVDLNRIKSPSPELKSTILSEYLRPKGAVISITNSSPPKPPVKRSAPGPPVKRFAAELPIKISAAEPPIASSITHSPSDEAIF